MSPQFLAAASINRTEVERITDEYLHGRSGVTGVRPSIPGYQGLEILVGDTLYFSAYDLSSGYELWAHDTSNASTWRVTDINSGTGHSLPGQYMAILVGDTLYFDANDGSSGQELWAMDIEHSITYD